MSETCIYCRAVVPDTEMGYHYAGYKCPPCPEVFGAFGPLLRKNRVRAPMPAGVYDHAGLHKLCKVCHLEPVYKFGRCWACHRDEIQSYPSVQAHRSHKKHPTPVPFSERKMRRAQSEANRE